MGEILFLKRVFAGKLHLSTLFPINYVKKKKIISPRSSTRHQGQTCSFPRHSCHGILSPSSGHVHPSGKPSLEHVVNGIVLLFIFFRTSFCPMTDDDQHIQESQLKVFVRCKENAPKQRRRKHSRLHA